MWALNLDPAVGHNFPYYWVQGGKFCQLHGPWDHKGNWDLKIPHPNHPTSVSIYIVVRGEEDRKEGR